MYAMNDDGPPTDVADLLGNFATAEEVNPPDIDPMGMLNRGYGPVDLGVGTVYGETMYATVGSHRNYHELGALAMLAAAMQHRWLALPYAQHGKLRPNIFGCMLGRSTYDHKTTAGSKVTQTLRWAAMPNAAALPGYFSEEGLYKELSDHPMGLIWRDEIAMLFASRNRKYTEFVIPFLTNAYDGWMPGKRLSTQSYASREIALSILGATTYSEFTRTTTESDWDSGWLVRWLFAMPDADYDPAPDLRAATAQDEQALIDVGDWLAELNARQPRPMLIDGDASDHLKTWRRTLIHASIACVERHERVDAIIERYATYAWKFAMLISAGKGDGERVALAHAQAATRLAENYMTNVYRLYAYQRENRLTGALLNKALGVLNRHVEGLTRRELGQLLNVNATQRDLVVERLLDAGVVDEFSTGRTKRLVATQKKLPALRVSLNGF